MQALKCLELGGPVKSDICMLQLTSLTGLKRVELTKVRPCVADSTVSVLARLMYQLAAKSPQVNVHVDETSLTD